MKSRSETEKPFASLAEFADMDVEAVAHAIEADEGESVPGIRDALEQLKRGEIGRIATPEQISTDLLRKTGMVSVF